MRIRHGYDLTPDHPLRRRLGQGPPAQPDPSASTLSSYYGPPFTRFFPLLRPSGALGVTSRGAAGATTFQPGAVGAGPGMAPGPAGPSGLLTDLYPWIWAPKDAFPLALFQLGTISVPIAGSANLVTLPTLPRGLRAVIKRFGQSCSDFANLTWTFLIRNQPQSPVTAMKFQFGQLNDARPLPEPGVILNSGDDFIVQVANTGAAIISGVGVIVTGWQWTVRE
jgi:hypothetical protein